MTNLTNADPQIYYGDILTTTNGGQGFSDTLEFLEDGLGNNSPVQLALNSINIVRGGMNTFQLDGTSITAPTVNINNMTNNNPICPGTASFTLPIGSTAQRPGSPTNGMTRYNSDINVVETYINGFWIQSNGNGSVTSVTGTANQISVVNSTTTPVLSLPNALQLPGTLTCSNIAIGVSGNNTITSTNVSGDINIAANGAGHTILSHGINTSPLKLLSSANPFVGIIFGTTAGGIFTLYGGAAVSYSVTLPTNAPTFTNNILTIPSGASSTFVFSDPNASCFQKKITQASHGFIVGNVLYFGTAGGGSFQTSIASGENSCNRTVGIVVSVIDVNNFIIQFGGYITLNGATLTAGTLYYLSPTSSGDYTDTKTTTSGQFIKPLFVADSATTGYFINQLGVAVP